MHITLSNAGKRYNREWIFRHLDHEFISGHSYAVTGPNGSGKSTLLQVIAGAVQHNEGTITYTGTQLIKPEDHYKHISFSAPYLELVEEMTATELLNFHATFKTFTKSIPDMLAEIRLDHSAAKQIRYFSSGMKQRLKLAQAFFSHSPVLLLDEPSTNLDAEGITLYKNLFGSYAKDKLVIISSNDAEEYDFCDTVIDIRNYKPTS